MTTMQQMSAAPSGNNPFTLGERWLSSLARANGGKWQRKLTDKQRGQLKMLANALGPLTNEVMEWATTNWWRFSREAARAAGLTAFPEEPCIGFLLAHCQVATNRMQEIAEAEALRAQQSKAAEEARIAGEKTDAKRWELLGLRDALGRRVYNESLEEIFYPTDAEYAAMLAVL